MIQRVTNNEAQQLIANTQRLESEKADRQAQREQRRQEKLDKQKQTFRERLVAPLLLLATLLISALLLAIY